MKKQFSVRTLVASAVLIALNIVITRLLSVNIGPVRIGLGFIPIAFGSMLYGTFAGTVIAALADVLGAVLSGTGYWPGFGLSAALYGVTYGLFLYKQEKSVKNIALCVILQAIFIDTLMGALWYNVYAGMAFSVALVGRAANAVAMIPVKILMIRYLWRYIGVRISKNQG